MKHNKPNHRVHGHVRRHKDDCRCVICAGMSKDDFYRNIQDKISQYGQQLIGIFDSNPPFIYTIGNHEHGLPELLNVGLDPQVVGSALNALGRKMREDAKPLSGDVNIGGQFSVRIIEATNKMVKDKYTIQVGHYYRTHNYRVLQIIIPDPNGYWPTDPRCARPYTEQPLLGAISQ
jgi:hypothetical protein